MGPNMGKVSLAATVGVALLGCDPASVLTPDDGGVVERPYRTGLTRARRAR